MKGFDTFKNALTFETKRLCVSTKAPLCFNQNSLALRCTENSCQFENLFLTKLTG